MARMGKFSADGLKKFQEKLNKIQQQDVDAFVESCAKEIAKILLNRVIKRTPVGDYSGLPYECKVKDSSKLSHKGSRSTGRHGGNLRRGWTVQKVVKEGNVYKVEVVNPTEDIVTHVQYASYVEYGHRTRDHKGWVPGHLMLTISEQEVQEIAPKLLESKIAKYLRECMG